MSYKTHTSSNGIRFIHIPGKRVAAHCIVMINTGTRDELANEHGMAHFLEHVLFKGTQKRSSYQIINRIEEVGGDLDAFTTKEDTCVYATFLPKHFERAIELLSDIVFHSVFPQNQLEREKLVINDEINSYKDSPAELIYDEFEELIFDGHPLGRNILGTTESLKSFNTQAIQQFCQRTYNTDQIVVCVAGNISYSKALQSFNKYFSTVAENKRRWKRKPFKNFVPLHKTIDKNTFQAHCMLGTLAYSYNHKDRLTLHLLNNILGGGGSNSRLNMALRERKGMVYFIESNYNAYFDSGVAYIYFGTDKEKLEKALSLVLHELKKVREIPLTDKQLSVAKNQFYGQMALSFDNQESLAMNLTKSYMVFKKIDDLDVIQKEIESITAEDIIRVANEIYSEEKLSSLKYI
ncbi:MAG TPA: pitrilysin family protein [Bacteroidales bacterium]|nr:insulinase family protein [Bacteroidales bacterium]HNV95766.1 pitrilysin family protein [Bacteroidales bacterium]